MSKNGEYVSLIDLRRSLPIQAVSLSRVNNAIRNRVIRSMPNRRRGRRLIHLDDSRKYFARVREALRSGRTTKDPWRNPNGVVMLPVGPIAGSLGAGYATRALIVKWHAHGCCYLPKGRKLRGEILLAAGKRGDVDSLIPTLFVRQGDWRKVEAGVQGVASGKAGAARLTAKAPKRPDPRRWADTDETMDALLVDHREELDAWNRHGYPAPEGETLPLGRKKTKGQPGGKTFWNRKHVNAIAPYRKARRSDTPGAVLAPIVDPQGNKRLRFRAIRRYMLSRGVPKKRVPSVAALWLMCPEMKPRQRGAKARRRP